MIVLRSGFGTVPVADDDTAIGCWEEADAALLVAGVSEVSPFGRGTKVGINVFGYSRCFEMSAGDLGGKRFGVVRLLILSQLSTDLFSMLVDIVSCFCWTTFVLFDRHNKLINIIVVRGMAGINYMWIPQCECGMFGRCSISLK